MASHRTGDTRIVGTTVDGRYTIEELIGRGGMATVYRARDGVLGRSVALKMFAPGIDDAQDLQRKASEIRLLAALNHPALVTLYDAHDGGDDTNGQAYMVMELAEGPSLSERLAEGPVAPNDVASMAGDLGEALHTVHAAGVVHRDVKPSNVLLVPSPLTSREFRPKLADFGIASLIDATRITAPGTLIGTAAYLSPEQAHGDPVTSASDIYSLGLVLLESLTGRRPFTGSAIEVTLARLLRDPEVSESLGSGWTSLLTAMTRREPGERPAALQVAESARRLIDPRRDSPPAAIVVPDVPATRVMSTEPLAETEPITRTEALDPTRRLAADAYPATEAIAPTQRFTATERIAPAPRTAPAPQTAPSPRTAPLRPAAAPPQRRGPSPWLIVLVLALVAVAVGLAIILIDGPQSPLPQVDGELGDHLRQLRESIRS
ncbi:serine/threonine protein kinase [Rathayibacter sp. AY1D2]|uniref:serine/threonine-protein kinase n=1 Tax=unclassified Rathayibacter TaxID=2609250 RepID=UPI000CE760B9|nr:MULTISPECIES: serine/threonine-protein kinase [unclassified Rathayibacter]PPH52527.1 serine/threonine protein kinase [Rathayibacter sp. AY1E1]PPI17461.1 serine/threonine protein kinase [Rathayibacter sp. AY1D2]